MYRIFDKLGNLVKSYDSLRSFRKFTSETKAWEVCIRRLGDAGQLKIVFVTDETVTVDFASFDALKKTVRYWRNLYLAKLFVNGYQHGVVNLKNYHLK